MLKQRKLNCNGITLVALVVTIIVLIILAGISINLLLGQNGIITKAKLAKENMELAKIEEETILNEVYMQVEAEGATPGSSEYDTIVKLTEFKKAIADYIGEVAPNIKPEYTADANTFGDSIKQIVTEVTKDATATADNITEGYTAWVNGQLITGNGADNQSSLEQGKELAGVTLLGTARSYNLTTYENYQSFTNENFLCVSGTRTVNSGENQHIGDWHFHSTATFTAPVVSYNSSTGALSITGGTLYTVYHRGSGTLMSPVTVNVPIKVYLVK